MAAAADSSSKAHSPHFRRNSRNLASPWSHVVRGGELAPAPASPSSPPPSSPPAAPIAPPEAADRSSPLGAAASGEPQAAGPSGSAEVQTPPPPASDGGDHGSSGNAAAPPSREKKSAWSRPSNGLTEAEPVMGAVSWPALSEATKASPKSSSSDSMKALPDGSVFAPPAPLVTSPRSKTASNISNSNSSTNHALARQKSGRRGGGNSSGSNVADKGGAAVPNGRPVPPLIPPTPVEVSQNSLGKPVASEPSIRDLTNRGGGNWEHGSRVGGFSSQVHGGNENRRNYGGNKRGNNGPGPHHNFGNRRDQEWGGHDWNHRPFGGGRDAQIQQRPQHQPRGMMRPFLRPPQIVTPPFIAPPPRATPFGSPMGFHDIPSPFFYVSTPPPPESLVGMPFVASPPPMFFPAPDPQLQAAVAKQIDYYFSSENLCKDIYLRQNMDEEGWVAISLIAGFNRVRNLTNSIHFILETLKASTVVEVKGDKVRRRDDWMNWPPLTLAPNPSPSAMPNYDSLAAQVKNVGLEEGTTSVNNMKGAIHTEIVFNSSSGELNSQSPMVKTSKREGTEHRSTQSGSE